MYIFWAYFCHIFVVAFEYDFEVDDKYEYDDDDKEYGNDHDYIHIFVFQRNVLLEDDCIGGF